MLMHFDVRREQICYLIPELCRFVGVNEELMNERKPYTEVRIARNTDAPVKINEVTRFVDSLMQHKMCQEHM